MPHCIPLGVPINSQLCQRNVNRDQHMDYLEGVEVDGFLDRMMCMVTPGSAGCMNRYLFMGMSMVHTIKILFMYTLLNSND